MARFRCDDADARAGAIEAGEITQAAPVASRGIEPLLHRRIEFVQAREEFVDRNIVQRFRHQAFDGDLVQRQFAPGFTREDHQLARDVGAGKIVARIGFGVAERACFVHEFGERPAAVEGVEQPCERARQHAFDPGQFIAGVEHRAQRLDHRQARADRGFVTEMAAIATGRGDRLVTRPVAAARMLVRGDDVDAGREPARIVRGDVATSAAIDDQRMRQVLGAHVRTELLEVDCFSGHMQCVDGLSRREALSF